MNDSQFQPVLQQLIEQLKTVGSQEKAVELLLGALMQLAGAERGALLLKNRITDALEVQAALNLDPEASNAALQIAQEVIKTGSAVTTNSALLVDKVDEGLLTRELRAIVGIPIKAGPEVRGAVYLDHALRVGAFAETDVAQLSAFVDEAVTMLATIPPAGRQAASEPEPEASPPEQMPPPPAPLAPAPASPPGSVEAPKRDQSASTTQPDSSQVTFSVFHPRAALPNEWQPLAVYVYKALAEEAVNADAGRQLGPLFAGARRLTQIAKGLIREGAIITATPVLPGFQFNPPNASIAFFEDWHRFDFKMRAMEAPLYQAANGRVTFTVEGIIVGDLPLSVYVGESAQNLPPASASRKLYQAVFCSYSRKDIQIVERVERAYKALGLDYLRDMQSLRSGESWSEGLRALIDRADIFQLFWSEAAAASQHVRMEWEYALGLGRVEQNFIRPVYWTNPIPAVPPELKAVHFAYQPDLVE